MSDGVARGRAATAEAAADPSLRGRTLAIPFEDVWKTVLALASGRLRGWTLVAADDHEGTIDATASRITGALYDVRITIVLDANAQTRVDVLAVAHKPATDFGTSARLIRRFFRKLDAALVRSAPRNPIIRS
jgi:hypothetical protein